MEIIEKSNSVWMLRPCSSALDYASLIIRLPSCAWRKELLAKKTVEFSRIQQWFLAEALSVLFRRTRYDGTKLFSFSRVASDDLF